MRVLITGVVADGRSSVIGETDLTVDSLSTDPEFWFANIFETTSTPPPPRPAGHGHELEVGLTPGLVRWQVIDYAPEKSYPMHHTDTVDIDIVLDGSIQLTVDDGSHWLRAGDGAVINGVDHAWKAGPEGARLSVVFIGTPPAHPG
jgi:quercetin dioxygenase-like cupin family protein